MSKIIIGDEESQTGGTPSNEIVNSNDALVQGSNTGLGIEFEVPTETVELPSRGVLYPGGKKSVNIKFMTAEEDDILFSPDLIKSGRVLDALLDVVVIDRDLRPEDMLSGDRNYLLIETRKTGFGDDYQPGDRTCSSCQYVYNPVVDLSKLAHKVLPEEISPDENGWFAVQLPMRKLDIKFRFLNGRDEKKLSRVAEKGQRSVGTYKVSRLVTEKYLLQIMEVNGNKDKTYIKSFIKTMPTRDSYFFRDYVRRIEPGIDLSYDFECPSCGNVETKDVPITPKLFYPDMED